MLRRKNKATIWCIIAAAVVATITAQAPAGIVRGGGAEQFANNANPAFNRDRFVEAHDLMVTAIPSGEPFWSPLDCAFSLLALRSCNWKSVKRSGATG